jgi:fibronectin-binding autotransporter adhesin
MSGTSWAIGLSGDWSRAANWTNGAPDSTTDAAIDVVGTYTVTLSDADGTEFANSLTLDSAGATFLEAKFGQLALGGALTIDAGTAILDGEVETIADGGVLITGGSSTLIVRGDSNSDLSIGPGGDIVVQNSGLLELANPAALGQDPIEVQGGELLATATGTLSSPLTLSQGNGSDIIAAAAGATLTLSNGDWSITQSVTSIQFGTAGDTGTIVWDTSTPGTQEISQVTVEDGTLRGGDANFGEFFADAGEGTTVAAGATLDLAGANVTIPFLTLAAGGTLQLNGGNATLSNLGGNGTITSSIGAPTVTLTSTAEPTAGAQNLETVAVRLMGPLSLDLLKSTNATSTLYEFIGRNTYTGTTTVEAGADLSIGDALLGGTGTSGTLGTGVVNLASIGSDLIVARSGSLTVANVIVGSGSVLYLGGGTYLVTNENTYSGGTFIDGNSVCETAQAESLGSGGLSVSSGGEFLATGSLTIDNGLSLAGTATIAAANGKTLTLDLSSHWEISSGGTKVVIGDAKNGGTVLWEGGSGGTFDDNLATLEIASGTLQDGDGTLGVFLDQIAATTIDRGATLVLQGTHNVLNDLQGSGTISATSATGIYISGGDFGGVFRGPIDLTIEGATILTGLNTSLTSVLIINNTLLALGDGGRAGSVGAALIDIAGGNSSLIIDHSNAIQLANKITGSGTLEQFAAGTTTATNLAGFDGTLEVVAGELLANDTASHAGLDLEGGTFLASTNLKLSSDLTVSGAATIAAVAKTTFNMDFSSWSFDATSITFGDSTGTGTIVWHTPQSGAGIESGDVYTVAIDAGVLKLADSNLGELLFPAKSTMIAAGATLNIGTFEPAIGDLLGAGTIIGTSGSELQVENGDFSGQIKGATGVEVLGDFKVSGNDTFTGGYELTTGSILTLDHAATQNATFFGDATLALTLGHAYSGTVFNFDLIVGQTIDFEGLSFANATEKFANGVLSVSSGKHSEQVALSGSFSNASFALSNDNHGGVIVSYTGIS